MKPINWFFSASEKRVSDYWHDWATQVTIYSLEQLLKYYIFTEFEFLSLIKQETLQLVNDQGS